MATRWFSLALKYTPTKPLPALHTRFLNNAISGYVSSPLTQKETPGRVGFRVGSRLHLASPLTNTICLSHKSSHVVLLGVDPRTPLSMSEADRIISRLRPDLVLADQLDDVVLPSLTKKAQDADKKLAMDVNNARGIGSLCQKYGVEMRSIHWTAQDLPPLRSLALAFRRSVGIPSHLAIYDPFISLILNGKRMTRLAAAAKESSSKNNKTVLVVVDLSALMLLHAFLSNGSGQISASAPPTIHFNEVNRLLCAGLQDWKVQLKEETETDKMNKKEKEVKDPIKMELELARTYVKKKAVAVTEWVKNLSGKKSEAKVAVLKTPEVSKTSGKISLKVSAKKLAYVYWILKPSRRVRHPFVRLAECRNLEHAAVLVDSSPAAKTFNQWLRHLEIASHRRVQKSPSYCRAAVGDTWDSILRMYANAVLLPLKDAPATSGPSSTNSLLVPAPPSTNTLTYLKLESCLSWAGSSAPQPPKPNVGISGDSKGKGPKKGTQNETVSPSSSNDTVPA